MSAEGVVRSGVYSFGASVGVRGLQFLRTIVAARLLAPDDFGRFVLAAAILGVLEAVSQPSLETAVVQARTADTALLRTAWTIRLLRGVVLAAAIFALAPTIASLLGEPSIAWMLRVLALVGLMHSFSSMSLLLQARQANLVTIMRLQLTAEGAETVVAVAAVAASGSPWGLVAGRLAAGLVYLCGSYLVRGFVPRLQLVRARVRQLFDYGRWVFLSNSLAYLSSAGDDVVVGAVAGPRTLGLYRVAYRFANIPVFDLWQVAGQVAFPTFARLNERSMGHAREVFHRYVILMAGIAAPGTVLVALTAHDLILTVVGSDWTDAATPLAIMAVAGFFRAMTGTGEVMFSAVGRPELETAVHFVRTVVLFVSLAVLLGPLGITGAALATLISGTAALPLWAIGLARVGIDPRRTLVAVGARVATASGCAISVLAVQALVDDTVARLLLGLGSGALVWYGLVRIFDRRLRDELSVLVRTAMKLVFSRRRPPRSGHGGVPLGVDVS